MKGWRTRIAAILTAGFGAAQTLAPNLQQSIDPKYYGLILIGIGVAFAILRELTNTAPGAKAPEAPDPDDTKPSA